MPDCVTIFILPPSLTELERRLRDRRTDADAVIERRLRDALSDIGHWTEFDYIIINDDLNQAVAELEAVFSGEGAAFSTENPELRAKVGEILAK
jgi:guanylate kinase